ncbi:MAG: RNA-binding protein [Patescibacteria group bacterium]|nr:RNA-binding protein [Patescibacteria group bacterium]
MNNKLYVGNLSYDVTNDQLGELFAQAGNVVDAVVITDKMSGRSKGFGFVEMSTPEEAAEALKKFNGSEFSGRKLIVDQARQKEETPQE